MQAKAGTAHAQPFPYFQQSILTLIGCLRRHAAASAAVVDPQCILRNNTLAWQGSQAPK